VRFATIDTADAAIDESPHFIQEAEITVNYLHSSAAKKDVLAFEFNENSFITYDEYREAEKNRTNRAERTGYNSAEIERDMTLLATTRGPQSPMQRRLNPIRTPPRRSNNKEDMIEHSEGQSNVRTNYQDLIKETEDKFSTEINQLRNDLSTTFNKQCETIQQSIQQQMTNGLTQIFHTLRAEISDNRAPAHEPKQTTEHD